MAIKPKIGPTHETVATVSKPAGAPTCFQFFEDGAVTMTEERRVKARGDLNERDFTKGLGQVIAAAGLVGARSVGH